MHELRRHPRVDFDHRAWCEHQNLTLYLPVANVSAGGMFLQTSAPFRTGDKMRVSIELEDQPERIVAEVEIVWLGKAGRAAGVGCRVVRFAEGEHVYAGLLNRLTSQA